MVMCVRPVAQLELSSSSLALSLYLCLSLCKQQFVCILHLDSDQKFALDPKVPPRRLPLDCWPRFSQLDLVYLWLASRLKTTRLAAPRHCIHSRPLQRTVCLDGPPPSCVQCPQWPGRTQGSQVGRQADRRKEFCENPPAGGDGSLCENDQI